MGPFILLAIVGAGVAGVCGFVTLVFNIFGLSTLTTVIILGFSVLMGSISWFVGKLEVWDLGDDGISHLFCLATPAIMSFFSFVTCIMFVFGYVPNFLPD